MKKKRKSPRRGKNKPVSYEAEVIGWLINVVNERSERGLRSDAAEQLIKGVLLRHATASDGYLSQIDREIRRSKKTPFEKVVIKAYENSRASVRASGRQFPTHDEICSEYCKITGGKWTDSIASQVRRAVTNLKLPVTGLRKPRKLKNTK
jgi:hypothetical protein